MSSGRSYVNQDDIRPYAFQYDENDLALWDKMSIRASRIFDIMCYVPAEYFFPSADPVVASAKVFYGTGSVFLPIQTYHDDIVSVTMPSSYTVPSYIAANGCLRTTNSDGIVFEAMQYGRTFWPRGVPVTITAKWGFDKVPEDVKEAVLELLMAMWRSKDQAFLKAVNLENNTVIVKDMPDRTKMVAAFYQSRKPIPAFV